LFTVSLEYAHNRAKGYYKLRAKSDHKYWQSQIINIGKVRS